MAKEKVIAAPKMEARAIRRHEVRQTYDVMNAKQEMYSDNRFASVQSPMSSFYAGVDPRRKWEVADAGMVSEDQNAMSNLSPVGYQKQYPAAGYYTTPYLDDIVKAPDNVREEDGSFYRRPKRR